MKGDWDRERNVRERVRAVEGREGERESVLSVVSGSVMMEREIVESTKGRAGKGNYCVRFISRSSGLSLFSLPLPSLPLSLSFSSQFTYIFFV